MLILDDVSDDAREAFLLRENRRRPWASIGIRNPGYGEPADLPTILEDVHSCPDFAAGLLIVT